jgi:hypothetical protein
MHARARKNLQTTAGGRLKALELQVFSAATSNYQPENTQDFENSRHRRHAEVQYGLANHSAFDLTVVDEEIVTLASLSASRNVPMSRDCAMISILGFDRPELIVVLEPLT